MLAPQRPLTGTAPMRAPFPGGNTLAFARFRDFMRHPPFASKEVEHWGVMLKSTSRRSRGPPLGQWVGTLFRIAGAPARKTPSSYLGLRKFSSLACDFCSYLG